MTRNHSNTIDIPSPSIAAHRRGVNAGIIYAAGGQHGQLRIATWFSTISNNSMWSELDRKLEARKDPDFEDVYGPWAPTESTLAVNFVRGTLHGAAHYFEPIPGWGTGKGLSGRGVYEARAIVLRHIDPKPVGVAYYQWHEPRGSSYLWGEDDLATA